jgi:putrescine aminotransferase
MRTGELWGISTYGVTPDILVTGKGLSGGLYPIAAVLLSERAGQWLHEDGFGHISSFGGAELGCIAAMKVLEITQRPETRANVHAMTARMEAGLQDIQSRFSDFFLGIRQRGLVIGLEFAGDESAVAVTRHLYRNGIWAIFSTLDKRVLQFKPGVLISEAMCDEILARLETGIAAARGENQR